MESLAAMRVTKLQPHTVTGMRPDITVRARYRAVSPGISLNI